jgi:hypothetical protein
VRPRRPDPPFDPEKPPPFSVVHARRESEQHALCGAPPGVGGWTRRRKFVTCDRCHKVIGERLMHPGRTR